MSIKVNGIKKITNLTAANTINDADVFMIETSSGSRKVTGATLKTLINDSANSAASSAADGVVDIIGAEFDANNSYEVGDYVIQDGKLYKFTSPHETGAFDGTDAEEVTITDELVSDVRVNGTSIVTNGVANVPLASNGRVGVVMPNPYYGLQMINGNTISLFEPDIDKYKEGIRQYQPVTISRQHVSTFYGLAKAAGDTTQSASNNAVGTYTEEAKTAIKTMLGVNEGIEVVRLA